MEAMTENILLNQAGGSAAIGAIKSLKAIGFKGNIVTIDSEKLLERRSKYN